MLQYGAFNSQEDWYEFVRKDLNVALRRSMEPYEASKCMFLGAHTGGDKGAVFMEPYLDFWKKTLLN